MAKHIDIKEEHPTEWVNQLLEKAITARASDVHLEPDRDAFAVRFRIDGMLYPSESVEKHLQEEILSRIKVISQMDITERRYPQDGHIEFTHAEKNYNVRVSTFPTIYGEAAVLRILNREDILLKTEGLGFEKEQLAIIQKLMGRPYGMVLITGPSGSGKTTLLYSVLHELNKASNNIVTLEDPVEFHMDGIRQTQISETLGLTFSRAMRSVLRQDPDIVMVGEIRDADTAQMAIQAALTGRLLFSTFHTLDVAGVVIRLIEMGIPRSVVAHTLAGVVSSRLVRKICSSCVVPHTPSPRELKDLGLEERGSAYAFKKGEGCANCRESGYRGRTGIFEVVYFDDEVVSHIVGDIPVGTLRDLFQRKEIFTLRAAALSKVVSGITSVEEAIRVMGAPLS